MIIIKKETMFTLLYIRIPGTIMNKFRNLLKEYTEMNNIESIVVEPEYIETIYHHYRHGIEEIDKFGLFIYITEEQFTFLKLTFNNLIVVYTYPKHLHDIVIKDIIDKHNKNSHR